MPAKPPKPIRRCRSVAWPGYDTSTISAMLVRYPRHHHPSGVVSATSPSVDVFIPTCGEHPDIVEKTVAAVRIRHSNKIVYILDDAQSSRIKKLAEKYFCGYIARKEHLDATAGNLNHALRHTHSDLVLALDADQVPAPDILERLIGFFRFSDMALVQSRQRFIVPEGNPFGNSDEFFNGVVQAGKDNDNAAFSCGSGVLYRRQAIESIGWNKGAYGAIVIAKQF